MNSTKFCRGNLPNLLVVGAGEGRKKHESIQRGHHRYETLGISDAAQFPKFCENHLTVKPSVIRHRDDNRLVVRLSDPEVVEDLISSSVLLRASSDNTAKQTFFNHASSIF